MSIFNKEANEKELSEFTEEVVTEEVPTEEAIEVPSEEIITPVVEMPKEEVPEVPQYNDEMGIVALGTIIHGDVKTDGHLVVAGVVEGNVNCAGNLMLTGEIKGACDCNNIVLDSNNCSPVLHVKESVSIKENTRYTGDITCKHISVNGTVIGNISASGNLGITKGAVVEGDITAAVLAIEPGAKIKGYVNIQ